MLGHVSRMPPSADAYKDSYQDIPSDWRRRPGRPRQSWLAPHTEICGNSIMTWTILNLLLIVYCEGGWFVALHTTLVHATDDVYTHTCLEIRNWSHIATHLVVLPLVVVLIGATSLNQKPGCCWECRSYCMSHGMQHVDESYASR